MKSFNYCCCIIAAIGLIFLGFAVIHSSNNTAKVELKPKVLCEAKSISVRTSQISTASVLLPPNSAITKIYVSMTQREGNPIDSGFISTISAGPTVFQHRFIKTRT